MRDQADRLRQMALQFNQRNRVEASPIIKAGHVVSPQSSPDMPHQPGPRIIAVTSGKGGVGKTNLTVNIALALARAGHRTILMDADLGLANVDVVLGMVPQHTLREVIDGSLSINQIICPGPLGLSIIAGGNGVTELADLEEWELRRFIGKLSELDQIADYILIDTGAGIAKAVMGFVLAAQETIVITTPEPTAITDAYAMIKAIHYSRPDMRAKLLVNRVSGQREAAEVHEKLNSVTQKFLGLQLPLLGFAPDDPSVARAVRLQEPFLIRYPNASVSRSIEDIVRELTDNPTAHAAAQGAVGFFSKVISLFR